MTKHNQALEFLKGALGQQIQLKGLMLPGVPIYVTQAFTLCQFGVGDPEQYELLLLTPKRKLTFEQIMNPLRLIRRLRERAIPVLNADDVNPKFRPLLVREKIPFIYRDKTIFIPEIGLKGDIGKMMAAPINKRLGLKDAQLELKGFALKIIGGYLTDQVPEAFSQGSLFDELKDSCGVSRTKFSEAIRSLVDADLLTIKGLGPNKEYRFASKQQLWERVAKIPHGKLFGIVEIENLPLSQDDYVLAGESALSNFSNLAAPNKKTIAVTSKVFKKLKQRDQLHVGNQKVKMEVWKEDPKLFSIRENLNPIELYFSLRNDLDDRVQISLQEMLNEHDIKMEGM
ncbi:MAG: hypothetical protein RJB66_1706 [Pseudomonadota bacterium]|jgi:hypothetical protein